MSGISKKKTFDSYNLTKKAMDYLDSFSFLKTVFQELNTILTFAILFSFNHFDLYFSAVNLSLSRPSFFFLCMVTVGIIHLLIQLNPHFLDKKRGLVVETILTLEFLFFYLFAQYHFWISAALLAFAVVGLFWLNRTLLGINKREERMTKKLRRWCWYRSSSLMACVMCVVLAVPAFVGYYEEFERSSLSFEDWDEFFEWYDEDSAQETDKEPKPFPNEDKISGLLEWDALSLAEKERTIRAIAMIEKEALGINDDVEITVYSEKMLEGTCGYYINDTKEIFINYRYLNEGELTSVIQTILHEMHHAFVYDTVKTLDFESQYVQQSYFFKRAREWNENIDNYVDALTDFDAYQAQPLEADARAYAEQRVLYYLDYINQNKAA